MRPLVNDLQLSYSMSVSRHGSGLRCLALMLKYFDMPVDLDALHHRFGAVEYGSEHIVRAAKEYKLKARSISVTPDRLKDLPLPGIIPTKDGRFIVAGKVSDKGVLIQDPESIDVNLEVPVRRRDLHIERVGLFVPVVFDRKVTDIGA